MKEFIVDLLKTSFMLYGVYCFVDKISDEKAKKKMKEEVTSENN